MSEELKPIGTAIVVLEKVSTLKDGGFRVTLDLADTEIGLVSELLKIKSNPHESPLFYVSFIKKPEERFSV